MRLRLIAGLGLLALLATPAGAQAYRASVLFTADAIDTVAAGTAAEEPDSTTAVSLVAVPAAFPTVNPALEQPSIIAPVLGGVLAGSLGIVGGALVGDNLDDSYGDIPEGAILGLLAGEVLLMPLGVHLGNARKGNFLIDLAVSAVVGFSAVSLAVMTDDNSNFNSTAVLLLGTAAQLGATVAAERISAGARAKSQP